MLSGALLIPNMKLAEVTLQQTLECLAVTSLVASHLSSPDWQDASHPIKAA